MILDLLFGWFIAAAEWVLSLLPTVTVPDLSANLDSLATSAFFQYTAWINNFVPLVEAQYAFLFMGVWWVAMRGFELTIWLLTKGHVLGGS